MRGAELPITTVIIVVLMVLTVVVILMFVLGVWRPFTGGYTAEQARSGGCRTFVFQDGCNSPGIANNIIVDYPEKGDTLEELCQSQYGTSDCRTVCGC